MVGEGMVERCLVPGERGEGDPSLRLSPGLGPIWLSLGPVEMSSSEVRSDELSRGVGGGGGGAESRPIQRRVSQGSDLGEGLIGLTVAQKSVTHASASGQVCHSCGKRGGHRSFHVR